MVTKLNLFNIDKKGITLIYVVLVMLVMSILGVSVFTLFSSNLATAKNQQDSVKAHFLAMAGIEVGLAAVLDKPAGEESQLLNTYVKSCEDPVEEHLNDTIDLPEGSVSIVICSYIDEKEDQKYVRISSTGTPNNVNTARTINLHVNAKYPELQKWD